MSDISFLARFLVLAGLVFVLAGILLSTSGRLPFLGTLPGYFVIRRGHLTVFFPLVASILLSLLLMVLLNIFFRR